MTKALNLIKNLNVVAECRRMSTGKCGIITLAKMKRENRSHHRGGWVRRCQGAGSLDNFQFRIFTPFNKDFFRFRHFLFGWMLTKRVTSFWMRFKVPLCQEQFNLQSKHRRPHRQQCCTMSPDCQDIRILRNDSVLCYQSHRIHSRLRNKQAIKGILVDRRESFHKSNPVSRQNHLK